MDRRSFVKLLAAAVAVPSLSGISTSQSFPVKWRYKGFDIIVTERPDRWYCKQVFASKGNSCAAVLFDKDEPMKQIEDNIKLWIDGLDRRLKHCA